MRPNAVRKSLADGKQVVNGWLAIPSAVSAETMAHCGFDSITIDMQHGLVDYQAAVGMLQALSTTDVTPMARVPWNEPGIMMKLLDAGAYGIVCPMINTREEAERYVAACRYPPMGARSFGPARASLYGGPDYHQHANDEVLLFAMVETRTALDNLDEILAVEGLDGVYIGPSDLSLSLGKPPTLAPEDAEVLAAMQTICDATKAKGRFAGVHTDSAKTTRRRFEEGFQFCTILNDVRLMANAATAAVKEARGEGPAEAAKTY
ncbi:MAG: aldolase/citrate lyase family protein [Hyphomicrobiales bacterium]|nr:aldolase/citrate lyase family protein [Hyphomicrobiales bacterium]